ncbi:vitamin B12 ABC transporter permease BtuC [Photobacterium phosphoreum]|uniref:Vitamin B12 import system permease protein BtuC n=1 Tax=Photobacterium phosphoreum TaxID=659 RepID=A0A2T3JQA4_PHOPO|nr:vitamin B12 ABC transporter permease BtuC [Photobacterium phosphoreum]KJF86685.1 Vitamin B12 import system permease BtuC [Photobacterium phosphoreum]MCD9461492.1 vitamin B12 ABC transporter permease BtuC [Photobacterium phosphoreum]MCD9469601.1 vitamin B12 ABC transporter permease BtuC [Photobacterium phosphoreum]MCD9473712.1 vitamin B12 ABC transporter permease BtuC [Photobacterium phosphoreum]MCD9480310.1 vitamin B12 ABC transporter permease BtuC [Photobacterium phosphoreum]
MLLNELLYRQQQRWRTCLIVSSLLLVAICVFAVAVGEIWILPWAPDGALQQQLLMQLRIPRVLAALIVGAALASSGAVLQVLLGNPLAEPGVLGISGGASLAVVLLLFLAPITPTPFLTMLAAMTGALLFTLILVGFSRRQKVSMARLLLIGVALGIFSGAVVTWAFYFSDDLSMRQLMYWLMGSVGGVSWGQLSLLFVIVPVLVVLCMQGKSLDVMMLGDVAARQLGVDVRRIRWLLILMVSLLVGCSVALAGVIGFVGLVVPHLLRLQFGTENRYLLPLSAICGGILLVLADTLSRVLLADADLPIGVVTTSLGAPVFIWMLMRSQLD